MITRTRSGVISLAANALTFVWLARAALRHSRSISLRGKKVLITGGSRGLGFAAARRFVRAGAVVAICARDQAELELASAALRDVARSASRRNGEVPAVVALRADVTDQHAATQLVKDVVTQFGHLDVLVNCAVQITVGPLEALGATDFQHEFRGISFAVYHPLMAALPHMKGRRFGRVVNVTSVAGKAPIPHNAAYVAGKFASTGFSAVCAAELRRYGIRVSTVCPPPLRNGAWLNGTYKGCARVCRSRSARSSKSTSCPQPRSGHVPSRRVRERRLSARARVLECGGSHVPPNATRKNTCNPAR